MAVSCSAAARRPSSTSSAQCHKAQYWVRCCSLSTQRTLQLYRTTYLYTRLPTTRSCICIVVASTLRQLLHGWNSASQNVGRWMCANRLKLNADKTELLWVGSRHSLSQQDCCLPVLQLGSDSIVARDHVRLLGVKGATENAGLENAGPS